MGENESLEESIAREVRIRNLFNQDKCLLEIASNHHIDFCKDYGTKICKSSKYRNNCAYAKRK